MEQIDEPVVHRFATSHETHSLYQNQRFPHCLFHETGWNTVDWGWNKLISTDGLHPPGFVYTNTSQWGSCHAVSGLLPDAFFQFFFSLQWPASDKIKMSTHYNTIYLLKICVISMYFSAHRRLYPPHPTTQQPVLVGHSTGTTCTSTYRYCKHLVRVLTTRYQLPATSYQLPYSNTAPNNLTPTLLVRVLCRYPDVLDIPNGAHVPGNKWYTVPGVWTYLPVLLVVLPTTYLQGPTLWPAIHSANSNCTW